MPLLDVIVRDGASSWETYAQNLIIHLRGLILLVRSICLFVDEMLTIIERVLFIMNLLNILMLRVRQYCIYYWKLSDIHSMPFLVFPSS
jgi:hypothetical protein